MIRTPDIARAARERYGARLARHGAVVKALGWDTAAHQRVRFGRAAELLSGSSLLDVGCGFGDFYAFLKERGSAPRRYEGIDLMPEFAAEARRRHAGRGVSFSAGDFFAGEVRPRADTVIALGILNFRLGSPDENYRYVGLFLRRAFACTRRRVVFDGISLHRTPSWPEEPAIFYADPARIAALVARVSPSFRIVHDLPPLPQREYLVCVDKEAR